jgi:ATP-dependent Clp protease adaptor protein ClpS
MTKQAAAAVAEPLEQTRTKRRRAQTRPRPKRQPRYHVILWDDQNHTHEYVVLMLQELFGHPPTKGFQLAEEVHNSGKAVVLTTTMEHAELKRDQIRAYGGKVILGHASVGSMYSTIEPAP